jgi:hypothetical protein
MLCGLPSLSDGLHIFQVILLIEQIISVRIKIYDRSFYMARGLFSRSHDGLFHISISQRAINSDNGSCASRNLGMPPLKMYGAQGQGE